MWSDVWVLASNASTPKESWKDPRTGALLRALPYLTGNFFVGWSCQPNPHQALSTNCWGKSSGGADRIDCNWTMEFILYLQRHVHEEVEGTRRQTYHGHIGFMME